MFGLYMYYMFALMFILGVFVITDYVLYSEGNDTYFEECKGELIYYKDMFWNNYVMGHFHN